MDKPYFNCDYFTIGEEEYIAFDAPIFEGRFTKDHYGKEAEKKLNDYGRVITGSRIMYKDKLYEIMGYNITYGSCDYIGSIVLLIKEKNNE